MNLKYIQYSKYALCEEMMESVEIIRRFNSKISKDFVSSIKKNNKILITGEGSSRIFPAKHFIQQVNSLGIKLSVTTEGALQSLEYDLDKFIVFGISNSGKTRELIRLFTHLKEREHKAYFGITATEGSILESLSHQSILLSCGKEKAVPATKSVMEQALFLESLLSDFQGYQMKDLDFLGDQIQYTLQMPIDPSLVRLCCNAPIIYYSGRNNGVAEELTLKTNEITHQKSNFIEGTYSLHGIEEVMKKGELMIVIEPFESEERKFYEVLVRGAGLNVIAISSRETCFPTIRIPEGGIYKNYIELAAGWNLLVEVGLAMGINLDFPCRARKIGNEVLDL